MCRIMLTESWEYYLTKSNYIITLLYQSRNKRHLNPSLAVLNFYFSKRICLADLGLLCNTVGPQSTYICRVQSSVWRLPKYWPPPHPTPSPQRECVLPRTKGGEVSTLAGRWGVNILEDARHWIGLLQFNPSTCRPIHLYKILDSNLTLCASSPLLSFSFTLNHLNISLICLLLSPPKQLPLFSSSPPPSPGPAPVLHSFLIWTEISGQPWWSWQRGGRVSVTQRATNDGRGARVSGISIGKTRIQTEEGKARSQIEDYQRDVKAKMRS